MVEVLGLVILGLIAGTLAASLGVGGGIVFVPVFVSFFGFSQLDAQGTSLAIVVPTAIVGVIGHTRAGRVKWKVSGIIGAVGIVGATAGALLAQSTNEDVLRTMFALVLALFALRMGVRTWALWRDLRTVDPG